MFLSVFSKKHILVIYSPTLKTELFFVFGVDKRDGFVYNSIKIFLEGGSQSRF